MNLLFLATTPPPATFIQDLAEQQVQVEVLHNLEDAARLAAARPFVAALVDVELNQINELPGICQYLKSLPAFDALPLLVVTPNLSNVRAAVVAAGADDLLTAPLEKTELLLRLRQADRLHTLAKGQGQNWHGIAEILLHDLKSPPALIISSLELLLEMNDGTIQKYLPFIRNSLSAARRANFLLEDMIDYILLRENDLELSCDLLRLAGAVSKARQSIDPAVQDKNVSVSYDISLDLPRVWADSELLQRVLNALADNALKFCIRKDKLCFRARAQGDYVLLEVSDSGRPIFPQYEATLFTPFMQSQARQEGSRSSVAMSLPFIKAAMRAMGGDVWASTHNKQTSFTLQFATRDPAHY